MRPIRGKENFFSTNNSSFISDAQLDQDEYDAVVDARSQWKKEGVPLSDTLNPDLLSKVKSKYSMRIRVLYFYG